MKTKINFIDENMSDVLVSNNSRTYVCSNFGVGKTSLLVKIAANYSIQDNKKILFVVNDDTVKNIERKFLAVYLSKNINELTENEIFDNKFLGENTTLKITKNFKQENFSNYDLIIFDSEDKCDFENYDGYLFISKTINGKLPINKKYNYIFLNKTIDDKNNNTARVNIISENFVVNDLKIFFDNSNLNISKMN